MRLNHRFTDQERTDIGKAYGNHVLMRLSMTVCQYFDSQMQNFSLWPEEIFMEAASILDDVKEKGDEFIVESANLWKEHYNAFRRFDPSVPSEEIKLAVSIVLEVPLTVLQCSKDSVHRYIGQQMLGRISINYEDKWERHYRELADACRYLEPEIKEWINGFMALDNEQYLSDEVADMLNPSTEKVAVPAAPAKPGRAKQELLMEGVDEDDVTARIRFLYEKYDKDVNHDFVIDGRKIDCKEFVLALTHWLVGQQMLTPDFPVTQMVQLMKKALPNAKIYSAQAYSPEIAKVKAFNKPFYLMDEKTLWEDVKTINKLTLSEFRRLRLIYDIIAWQ